MQVIELHQLTKQWAHDRGILTNGKVGTQTLKLVSEYGELNGNIATQKCIKDDIGDMLVVLTILSELEGFNLLSLTEESLEVIPDGNMLTMTKYIGDLADEAAKGNSLKPYIKITLSFLVDICRMYEHTIEECWLEAYNDIKDRQGFLTKSGTFVKTTDPRYKQLKMEFDNEQQEAK